MFCHPYISDPGTLLEGFEDVTDWTVTGTGATAENDTSIFKQGSQSIKLIGATAKSARIIKTVNWDLSDKDNFSLWFYVVDNTKFGGIIIYLSSTTDFSKYYSKEYNSLYTTNSKFSNGWNVISLGKTEFSNTGNESWANTIIRIKITTYPKTEEAATAYFDDLRFGIVGQPKVIITFDDGHAGQVGEAYPIMAANGQKGVAFIVTNLIDAGEYMTLANLQTLQSTDWDVSNHTAAHLNSTTRTQEAIEADIDNGYDWLVANGFENTAKFFAYPYGYYNDDVVAKLKQRHVLARAYDSTNINLVHFDMVNFNDIQYILNSYSVSKATTVATVQTWIDNVIERSGILVLVFHQIVDSYESEAYAEYLTANFQIISDYLKTKQDAGLLEVITFSDYYNALRAKMAQVTITVDNGQWSDFQKYYLKRLPIPTMEDPENPGERIPTMSVGDWIKECIVGCIYQTLLEGKQMEAFNELEIDIDIT